MRAMLKARYEAYRKSGLKGIAPYTRGRNESSPAHELELAIKETMTAARFITFLEGLLRETTRKVFLIVDRLRAHEAKAVEDWVAEHRDRIEIFFLPRYAPELNADEYLNNDQKGSINAEGLPRSQEELRSRMERFMSKLLHLPEHVRNYFRHPCVQYAAGV